MANLVNKAPNLACLHKMYKTMKRTITVKMLAEKSNILSGLEESRKFYGSIQTPYQYASAILKNSLYK